MRNHHKTYCVFLDVASRPHMYGIRGTNGVSVGRISTDFQEVNRLAESCNTGRCCGRFPPLLRGRTPRFAWNQGDTQVKGPTRECAGPIFLPGPGGGQDCKLF